MLLAAAAEFPVWAVQLGLVQFYGSDIDQTCVRMAQLNLAIHGLNGYAARCALAEAQAERTGLRQAAPDVSHPAPELKRPGDARRPAVPVRAKRTRRARVPPAG